MSEQIDDGDLTQSLTARFGNRGADLADGEANWLVPQAGVHDVTGAGENTDGTVAPPPRPDEPQAFESRFARNGRGAPSGEVPPLKAQSGQTGRGDGAPLVLPAQAAEVGPLSAKGGPHGTGGIGDQEVHQGHVIDPSLGQPVAGSLGGVGGTGGHRLDLDSSGAYVAAPPLAATLKGQRGKGGGGVGPEETLLPQGFINTESMSSGDNIDVSPTLRVENYASVAQPYSKRHAASDADDAETWDESEQAHTLNKNMNAPDVAADAQAVRRLTPTEAERLQGVPDGWTLPYGPSLADAPAWHDLSTPPAPVRAVTINEGNDTPTGSVWESEQVGSLTSGGGKPGQGYHAVRTEPADPTWIGLDNANRGNDHVKEGQQSAEALRAKGTLDQAICFHSDALGRDGEAKNSPDAEGRMRKRDAGTGITEGESYSLTAGAQHAVGFYPNQGKDSHAPGAREGESPTLSGGGGGNTPAVAYNVSGGGGETADLRASETDQADCLSTRGAWAYTQGGTLVPESAEHADALAFEARYYSDRERMGGAPSAEAGPVKATDSKAGDAAQVVAFTQNQREELRELDEASSLSGQGTHQTTYVAEQANAVVGIGHGNYNRHADIGLVGPREVVAGPSCPYDSPPDGPRYAALGDAVTASVSRWVGERLVSVLSEVGCIKDGCVDLTVDLEPNERGEYAPRAGAHSFGKSVGEQRESSGSGNP